MSGVRIVPVRRDTGGTGYTGVGTDGLSSVRVDGVRSRGPG